MSILHPKQKYPMRSVYACLLSRILSTFLNSLVFSKTTSALSKGAIQNNAQNNVFKVSDKLVNEDT